MSAKTDARYLNRPTRITAVQSLIAQGVTNRGAYRDTLATAVELRAFLTNQGVRPLARSTRATDYTGYCVQLAREATR